MQEDRIDATHFLGGPRLECNRTARELIWKKAKEIWPHGPQTGPNFSIGTILGVECISTAENRKPNSALSMANKKQTRLYTYLRIEAKFLVAIRESRD